jgi:hypothetical protein
MVGKVVMKTVNPLLTGKMKKFRAIHGRDVARAMILLIREETGTTIAESDKLQQIIKGQ